MLSTPAGEDNAPRTLETALAYLAAGLSVIAIRLGGSKAPQLATWKVYMMQRPSEAEVRQWFDKAKPLGIGIPCGKASGNLELLDFDAMADEIFPQWKGLVEAEVPGLVDRLTKIRTAGGGFHLPYRVEGETVPGNLTFAKDPSRPKNDQVLIETRGHGGQFVTVGSPLTVHESGKPYQHIAGPPLTQVATVTATEREVMHRCARFFDLRPVAKEKAIQKKQDASKTDRKPGDLLPGEDFDQRGDWLDVIGPHGWRKAGECQDKTLWARPDKDKGWSATTGFCKSRDGSDLLYVFSSNASPLEDCKSYGKFRAFAILNHNGDCSAAARELARRGFGTRRSNHANGNGKVAQPHTQDTQQGNANPEGNQLSPVSVDPFLLEPGEPRKTSSKTSLPLTVKRADVILFTTSITSAASGRKEAIRLLAMMGGDFDHYEVLPKAERALVQMLTAAVRWKPERPSGPTMLEILRNVVPPAFALEFRTDGGAWSELHGREVKRAEFLAFTPENLLQAVGEAVDLPKGDDGTVSLPDMVRTIEMGLRVLWASLVPPLGLQVDADLAGKSTAARRFRASLTRIFHQPNTFEVERGTGSTGSVASRASLISRVRQKKATHSVSGARDGWDQIHQAFSAWWRYVTAEDGEEFVLLAMRYDLAGQVNIPLDGVTEQAHLTILAKRYGVLDTVESRSRLTGGGRITLLSQDFCRELLSNASDSGFDEAAQDLTE